MRLLSVIFSILLAIPTFASDSEVAANREPLTIIFNSYLAEPYVFTQAGQVVGGIYWDIAQLVSQHIQRPVSFVRVPRKRVEQYLADGRAHVHLLSNPIWMDEPTALQWTSSVYTEYDLLIQNANNTFKVMSLDHLVNRRIGTIQGFSYAGISVEPYRTLIIRDDAKSFHSNFVRLERQRLDALITPKILADYYFLTEFDRNNFHVVKTWNIPHHIYSAVSPTSPITAQQLSEVYKKLQEKNEIEAILKKYR